MAINGWKEKAYNMSFMKKVIRKANAKDARILSELRVEFLEEVIDQKDHPDREDLKEKLEVYFREKLAAEELIVYLAEIDSEIISTSSMVLWQVPLGFSSMRSNGMRGYVLNMYTKKEFRRKGLSAILLNKLVEEAKLLNLDVLHLNATNDGRPLYEKHGFKDSKFTEMKLSL